MSDNCDRQRLTVRSAKINVRSEIEETTRQLIEARRPDDVKRFFQESEDAKWLLQRLPQIMAPPELTLVLESLGAHAIQMVDKNLPKNKKSPTSALLWREKTLRPPFVRLPLSYSWHHLAEFVDPVTDGWVRPQTEEEKALANALKSRVRDNRRVGG